MEAKMIIEVTIKNICNPSDLGKLGNTLPELTRDIIADEGHFLAFIEDDWKILAVEEKAK